MLFAQRKSDGARVEAYFEKKENGPFRCPECREEVRLSTGRERTNYFAHVKPIACTLDRGESDDHRRCKLEIFFGLRKSTDVSEVVLEQAMDTVRPDVFAQIRSVPVAIEIQLSNISLETIQKRTIEYFRKDIYVLWLLQWTPALEMNRYAPKLWERWIHALYFGHAYYWTTGLAVTRYHFEPSHRTIPERSWFSKDGKRHKQPAYGKRSLRYRKPVPAGTFNLVTDFAPQKRFWWEGGGLTLPDANLFAVRVPEINTRREILDK